MNNDDLKTLEFAAMMDKQIKNTWIDKEVGVILLLLLATIIYYGLKSDLSYIAYIAGGFYQLVLMFRYYKVRQIMSNKFSMLAIKMTPRSWIIITSYYIIMGSCFFVTLSVIIVLIMILVLLFYVDKFRLTLIDAHRIFRSENLFAISHRWDNPGEADKDGKQFNFIKWYIRDDCLIFYDYSSLFQTPRSDSENQQFKTDLKHLNFIFEIFHVFKIPSENYFSSAWCIMEYIKSSNLFELSYMSKLVRDDLVSIKTRQMSLNDFKSKYKATNGSDVDLVYSCVMEPDLCVVSWYKSVLLLN